MIVLVDDEPIILKFVTHVLQDVDPEIYATTSAAEALEYLLEYVPDLIISDILMDEMDGYTFREHYVRALPDRNTPFIFLSSMNKAEDVVRGLARGADDYIVKPFKPELLRAKVISLLRLHRRLAAPRLKGSLSDFPPDQIIRFCKQNKLTCKVTTDGGEGQASLEFCAGELVGETREDGASLLPFPSLGRFYIHDRVGNETVPDTGPDRFERTLPPGQLSVVHFGKHKFDVQTEVNQAGQEIVSTVYSKGKLLLRRSQAFGSTVDAKRLQLAIGAHHEETKVELSEALENKLRQIYPRAQEG